MYHSLDPRRYCLAMKSLNYVIPQQSKPFFSNLFDNYRKKFDTQIINVLDLGSSYGINSALLKYDIQLDEFYNRYTSKEAQSLSTQKLLLRDKNEYTNLSDNKLKITGFDISKTALEYGYKCSLLDDILVANLEENNINEIQTKQISQINCVISSGCFGYITTKTLEQIILASYPNKLWMTHCVLRIFSLKPLIELLEKYNYNIEISTNLVPQRRFASKEEKEQVLKKLSKLNIDTNGFEDTGWLYAYVVTATA